MGYSDVTSQYLLKIEDAEKFLAGWAKEHTETNWPITSNITGYVIATVTLWEHSSVYVPEYFVKSVMFRPCYRVEHWRRKLKRL